jgi:hypothetical protein
VPFYFSGTILLVVVFISLELMSNVRIALRPGDPTGIRSAS